MLEYFFEYVGVEKTRCLDFHAADKAQCIAYSNSLTLLFAPIYLVAIIVMGLIPITLLYLERKKRIITKEEKRSAIGFLIIFLGITTFPIWTLLATQGIRVTTLYYFGQTFFCLLVGGALVFKYSDFGE